MKPARTDEAPRPAAETTAFLIVSNARSGSTWLETSLGELPGVTVDYEMRWQPAETAPAAASHLLIPDGKASCRHLLGSIAASTPVVGSKLLLGANALTAEHISALLGTIEPDIRIIHLTRRYFDILLSWQGHGTIHAFRPGWKPDGQKHMYRAIRADESRKQPAAAIKMKSRIHSWKAPYYRELFVQKILGSAHPLAYLPLRKIIDTLLAFFLNDLIFIRICGNAKHARHVDYGNIPESFEKLAAVIGSGADNDTARRIIENPPTQKLERVPPEIFVEHRLIREIADCLDAAKAEAIAKQAAIEDYWVWSDDGRSASLNIEGLEDALGKHALSKLGLRSAIGTNQIQWEIGSPH